ncbi:hypothetical protein ACTFIR_011824 [Dictyostelium discoideum]
MKVIYIYLLLLLVCKFLFVKSSCSLNYENKKIECSNEFETFKLYNGTEVNILNSYQKSHHFQIYPQQVGNSGSPSTFLATIEGVQILNTTFETGAIPNLPILDYDKGILTIQGSNLYDTSIKIYSNNIVKDTNPIGALDASHSSVTFSVEEFLTPNNWTIEVSICGSFYKSYSYLHLPVLTKMEGVLNDKGGIMVFTGNHLRPKYNVTGTFGNKNIGCLMTNH